MTSPTFEIVKEREVEMWSGESQRRFGDSSSYCNALPQLRLKDLDVSQNELGELQAITGRMAVDRVNAFTKEYGWIAHLLFVPEQPSLLKALMHFWDFSYKCFTFGETDLTPTLEEYHCMLNIPQGRNNRLYVYDKNERAKKQLGKMMGLQTKYVEGWMNNAEFSIPKMIAFTLDNIHNDKGLRMLALLIYGLVLFPKKIGKIEPKVVIYFSKVVQNVGVNPITGILAETFRSLDEVKRQGGGRFGGCAPLLTMWALSHLHCPEHFHFPAINYGKSYDYRKNYILSFGSAAWPEKWPTKKQWIYFLQNLGEESIRWVVSWNNEGLSIFRCGGYLWVPLLGPFGGTGYAPCLVRRQFGCRQFIPVTAGLQQADFEYGEENTREKIKKVAEAWNEVKAISNECKIAGFSGEYMFWQQHRKNCMQEGSSQTLDLVAGEREVMGANVEDMNIEEGEIDISTRLMEMEIEELRNEVVNLRRDKQIAENEVSNTCQQLQQQKEEYEGRMQAYEDEIRGLQSENNRLQGDINLLWEHFRQKDQDLTTCEQWLSSTTERMQQAVGAFRALAVKANHTSQQLQHIREGSTTSNSAKLSVFLDKLQADLAYFGRFR